MRWSWLLWGLLVFTTGAADPAPVIKVLKHKQKATLVLKCVVSKGVTNQVTVMYTWQTNAQSVVAAFCDTNAVVMPFPLRDQP